MYKGLSSEWHYLPNIYLFSVKLSGSPNNWNCLALFSRSDNVMPSSVCVCLGLLLLRWLFWLWFCVYTVIITLKCSDDVDLAMCTLRGQLLAGHQVKVTSVTKSWFGHRRILFYSHFLYSALFHEEKVIFNFRFSCSGIENKYLKLATFEYKNPLHQMMSSNRFPLLVSKVVRLLNSIHMRFAWTW